MNIATMQAPTTYLGRLAALVNDIEQWSRAKGLITRRYTTELDEEAYGQYQAEGLQLLLGDGRLLATLVPVGASIIAAKGRVDLEGTVDRAILVDWDQGGPVFETAIQVGDTLQTHTQAIYKGVDEPGWYWVESRALSRAHKLNERLFLELLFLVSDHDLRD
ncbi:hypothetical protein JCM19379_19790 [Methyloparacoccus murrellii]